MSKDLNLSIVDGRLFDKPILHVLKSKKALLKITVQHTEKFRISTGEQCEHHSYIPVEVLGRNVDRYFEELVVGRMYRFSGYLRTDALENRANLMRLRCVNIEDIDDGN